MSEVTDLSNANKQKLVSDMKVVVADAEEILRATAGVAGEKMGDLRERFGERLRDARIRLADAEAALVDRTKAAARATDDYVHENPWRAVGLAAAVGLLLGVIESLGAGYIGDLTGDFLGSHYQDIFAFAVLILVLLFRPSGIMGERVADRA